MELVDLKLLVTGILLGGSVRRIERQSSGGCASVEIVKPHPEAIRAAVEVAQEIWEEVLRKDRA